MNWWLNYIPILLSHSKRSPCCMFTWNSTPKGGISVKYSSRPQYLDHVNTLNDYVLSNPYSSWLLINPNWAGPPGSQERRGGGGGSWSPPRLLFPKFNLMTNYIFFKSPTSLSFKLWQNNSLFSKKFQIFLRNMKRKKTFNSNLF